MRSNLCFPEPFRVLLRSFYKRKVDYMKKIMIKIMCAAMFFLIFGCAKEEENIVFIGTIEEIYDNSVLVTTTDEVGFDKANVSFGSDVRIGSNFIVGQTYRFTILPQIAESYPVQVTAIAIELTTEPSASDPKPIDYTVSFYRADSFSDGGWDFIAERAVNAESLVVSSDRHIPVISITEADMLAEFMDAGKAYFQFDVSYDGDVSFTDAASKYDNTFFDKNRLLILYTEESSGSVRHTIKDVSISENILSAVVEAIVPESSTDDMADWFIVLEISEDALMGCDKFDARRE